MKFRPTLMNLETRENPVGPQIMDVPDVTLVTGTTTIPPQPAPTPAPAPAPTTNSGGSQIVDPITGVAW